jgi:phage terminase large subunit-like protein
MVDIAVIVERLILPAKITGRGAIVSPTLKELRVSVVDGINGNKRAFKYEVVDLNAARLHLKYDSANFKQDLYYNIFN